MHKTEDNKSTYSENFRDSLSIVSKKEVDYGYIQNYKRELYIT